MEFTPDGNTCLQTGRRGILFNVRKSTKQKAETGNELTCEQKTKFVISYQF